MSDPRFARVHSDPRFVRPKAAKSKFVVDDRFKSLFDDQQPSGSKKSKFVRKVDKYGRPLAKEASVNELKRYYRLASPGAEGEEGGEPQEGEQEEGESAEEDDEEEDEEAPAPGAGFVDLARGEVLLESSDEEAASDDEDEAAAVSDAESTSSSQAGTVTLGGRTARRRVSRSPSIDLSEGEGPSLFPDEEDEAAADEDDFEDAEPTRRLAVVNMDWDHLRASDLYRVLASSLSATAASIAQAKPRKQGDDRDEAKLSSKLAIAPGRLLSLRIYPSEFGRERMEREAIEGPPVDVLRAKGAESSDEEADGAQTLKLGKKNKGKGKQRRRAGDEDDDFTEQDLVDEQLQDGEEDYDTEALRKYQLERLRYYYAIATFDKVSSAKHVVEQINGTEFERTANVFDLQYVPDDTSFDADPVHDEATEASIAAEGNSYTGLEFQTDALRHSKVKLTWDADDPHRKTKMQTYLAAALDRSKQKGAMKGKTPVADDEIAQYLASSSDEDEGEDGAVEEQDDFFEAAEEDGDAAAAANGAAGGKKASKRDRLRNLLGLSDADGAGDSGASGAMEVSWDGGAVSGGKKKGADAGMQITFAPALSERSAKQLEYAGEREETSIEKYKRKEKERKERKRAERKARREGKTVEEVLAEEAGAAGETFFGGDGGDDKGFDDDFFGEDGGDPFAAYDAGADSGDEIGVPKKAAAGKLSKKEKRAQREAEEKANAEEHARLALLVGSDDEDDVMGADGDGEGGRHFDMRKILKAEKQQGKKHKLRGKSKKAKAEDEPVNDEFKVNLADDRFKSLYEDYDFAVDPSNPRYQKSRNMEAILAEGRKRRATKGDKARAPVVAPAEGGASKKRAAAAADGSTDADSLRALAEAVKRKAGEVGGRGKRAKTG
ncbi:hypothetical protein Rhopal_005471-T1 [Rhodotorula paludigena]|uniref:NUC153 domain-containing protein n=1 Tax=Rhodotorula paludigena TaxID=86838 RepID=A0AAV5GSF4_9BASI|nr:hypothetical protein Rhopal_005471-T1 [Rhodotorula paludigena]